MSKKSATQALPIKISMLDKEELDLYRVPLTRSAYGRLAIRLLNKKVSDGANVEELLEDSKRED